MDASPTWGSRGWDGLGLNTTTPTPTRGTEGYILLLLLLLEVLFEVDDEAHRMDRTKADPTRENDRIAGRNNGDRHTDSILLPDSVVGLMRPPDRSFLDKS